MVDRPNLHRSQSASLNIGAQGIESTAGNAEFAQRSRPEPPLFEARQSILSDNDGNSNSSYQSAWSHSLRSSEFAGSLELPSSPSRSSDGAFDGLDEASLTLPARDDFVGEDRIGTDSESFYSAPSHLSSNYGGRAESHPSNSAASSGEPRISENVPSQSDRILAQNTGHISTDENHNVEAERLLLRAGRKTLTNDSQAQRNLETRYLQHFADNFNTYSEYDKSFKYIPLEEWNNKSLLEKAHYNLPSFSTLINNVKTVMRESALAVPTTALRNPVTNTGVALLSKLNSRPNEILDTDVDANIIASLPVGFTYPVAKILVEAVTNSLKASGYEFVAKIPLEVVVPNPNPVKRIEDKHDDGSVTYRYKELTQLELSIETDKVKANRKSLKRWQEHLEKKHLGQVVHAVVSGAMSVARRSTVGNQNSSVMAIVIPSLFAASGLGRAVSEAAIKTAALSKTTTMQGPDGENYRVKLFNTKAASETEREKLDPNKGVNQRIGEMLSTFFTRPENLWDVPVGYIVPQIGARLVGVLLAQSYTKFGLDEFKELTLEGPVQELTKDQVRELPTCISHAQKLIEGVQSNIEACKLDGRSTTVFGSLPSAGPTKLLASFINSAYNHISWEALRGLVKGSISSQSFTAQTEDKQINAVASKMLELQVHIEAIQERLQGKFEQYRVAPSDGSSGLVKVGDQPLSKEMIAVDIFETTKSLNMLAEEFNKLRSIHWTLKDKTPPESTVPLPLFPELPNGFCKD